jgi:hypothetical protein
MTNTGLIFFILFIALLILVQRENSLVCQNAVHCLK